MNIANYTSVNDSMIQAHPQQVLASASASPATIYNNQMDQSKFKLKIHIAPRKINSNITLQNTAVMSPSQSSGSPAATPNLNTVHANEEDPMQLYSDRNLCHDAFALAQQERRQQRLHRKMLKKHSADDVAQNLAMSVTHGSSQS